MKPAKRQSSPFWDPGTSLARGAWQINRFAWGMPRRFRADAKHAHRGGLDRSTIQLDREEARAHSSFACPIREARTPSERTPKDIPGDAGGNGRHDAPAGQSLHE